jgi:thiamine biosynthesis protein ThiC
MTQLELAREGTTSRTGEVVAQVEGVEAEFVRHGVARGQDSHSGADAVMDLSTGGDISDIRRKISGESALPTGTVPIYQTGIKAITVLWN